MHRNLSKANEGFSDLWRINYNMLWAELTNEQKRDVLLNMLLILGSIEPISRYSPRKDYRPMTDPAATKACEWAKSHHKKIFADGVPGILSRDGISVYVINNTQRGLSSQIYVPLRNFEDIVDRLDDEGMWLDEFDLRYYDYGSKFRQIFECISAPMDHNMRDRQVFEAFYKACERAGIQTKRYTANNFGAARRGL